MDRKLREITGLRKIEPVVDRLRLIRHQLDSAIIGLEAVAHRHHATRNLQQHIQPTPRGCRVSDRHPAPKRQRQPCLLPIFRDLARFERKVDERKRGHDLRKAPVGTEQRGWKRLTVGYISPEFVGWNPISGVRRSPYLVVVLLCPFLRARYLPIEPLVLRASEHRDFRGRGPIIELQL